MSLSEHNFGVIILCPDLNIGGLKYTTNSIKSDFPTTKYVAVVGNNAKPIDVDNLSRFSKIYKGGKTITSLIDTGMKVLSNEWCLIVMSGSIVRSRIINRYRNFSEDKSILYPVINRKYLFDEASINGIVLKKQTYNDIGPFGDDMEDIGNAKLMWAGRAIEKGYKFKALVGVRFI
jgi:hypothetical protein